MILYLIRHGKTNAHFEGKRQSPTTPLGELGRKQAEALANKMHLLKIDHLYSSDWPRAFQTAEFISKVSFQEIKIHPLVHEIKHSLLDDVSDKSEINLRYLKEVQENMDNFDWKFDGQGESINEVIERAKKTILFLEKKHPCDTVVLVTHGIFISVLATLILLGNDYDQRSFRKLCWNLRTHNTGVSTFKFDSETKNWSMICFNDHGHLFAPFCCE